MANKFELDGKFYDWYRRLPVNEWRVLRQYIYQRDNGTCLYCGEKVELNKCHCHHVLELSQGGTNHPTNLKTLCKKCHENRHPHMKYSIDTFGTGE